MGKSCPMNDLEIFIPMLPPGINATYGRGRYGQVYLTKRARHWKDEAALLIGSQAAVQEWKDLADEYHLKISWWGSRHDEDAFVKIIQDTLCEKLGFNDRKIKKLFVEKLKSSLFLGENTGILLILKTLSEKRKYYGNGD